MLNEFDESLIVELIKAAHRFQLTELVESIEKEICDRKLITIDNVLRWFEISFFLELKTLRRVTTELITDKSEIIIKQEELLKINVSALIDVLSMDAFYMPEDNLLAFIIQYVTLNKVSCLKLLDCIRFNLLNKSKFEANLEALMTLFGSDVKCIIEKKLKEKKSYRFVCKPDYKLVDSDYESVTVKKKNEGLREIIVIELNKMFKLSKIELKVKNDYCFRNFDSGNLLIKTSNDGQKWTVAKQKRFNIYEIHDIYYRFDKVGFEKHSICKFISIDFTGNIDTKNSNNNQKAKIHKISFNFFCP